MLLRFIFTWLYLISSATSLITWSPDIHLAYAIALTHDHTLITHPSLFHSHSDPYHSFRYLCYWLLFITFTLLDYDSWWLMILISDSLVIQMWLMQTLGISRVVSHVHTPSSVLYLASRSSLRSFEIVWRVRPSPILGECQRVFIAHNRIQNLAPLLHSALLTYCDHLVSFVDCNNVVCRYYVPPLRSITPLLYHQRHILHCLTRYWIT
jgi:hypothetical protein